jgi:4,4'-diaponeurosporenoate glycosyltransferase
VDFQPLGVTGIYIDRETGGGCNSQDAEGVRFMTINIIEFTIVLAGLVVTAILFYRIPILPADNVKLSDYPIISVIIPARNEEHNLPLLLADLSTQTFTKLEIICIDDDSEDSTGQIALKNGAKLITLKSKLEGWTGKSWACQNGADAATGELLLFLDADVRLGPDGISNLISAYLQQGCTVSVQPFHKTQKVFEQFSMMFNLVQVAANGTALPKPRNIGLYGPVILISRQDYEKAGGHESVKASVVDDIALGSQLKKVGLHFCLYIGNCEVSFRMYSGGLRSLMQGWVKNMATGAAKTPIPVFIMVFLWITSLLSVPLHIVIFILLMNRIWLVIYSIIYIIWACLLAVLTRRIGKYHVWAVLIYPILMFITLWVILVSWFKKLFGFKVTWKGRQIKTGEKI